MTPAAASGTRAGSSSNLTFYVPLTDDQAQYRVGVYTVGHQRSYTTLLSVAPDVDPPVIVLGRQLGRLNHRREVQ